MKFMTTEQLFDTFKHKQRIELDDFVQMIEKEFDVQLSIQEPLDDADVKAIAEDADVIRQIQASRDDRKAGRVFSQETGLPFLRDKIQEFEREQRL